ncbi:hypothetical protein HZC07_02015, partial [Candidatus Micrarchaeota archaeon]|nr:hypothetical protein [Candidatus Micrarchaeota archaeon]
MLQALNKLFLISILLFAIIGISLSILTLFAPEHSNSFDHLSSRVDFFLDENTQQSPAESPHYINITIHTPPLGKNDLLFLDVYVNKKLISSVDCLEAFNESWYYAGATELDCEVPITYEYES